MKIQEFRPLGWEYVLTFFLESVYLSTEGGLSL